MDRFRKRAGCALAALLLALALLAAPAAAQESEQEVTDEELQELLGEPGGQQDPSRAAGPGRRGPQRPRPVYGGTGAGGSASGLTGLSRAFNPALSVNGLVLGTGGGERNTDFGLQEFELRFSSIIDPYFRADITLAAHEDIGAGGHGEEDPHAHGGEEEGGFAVEQAEVASTAIPQATVRFGKFWLPFGKHNLLHTHQFPFVTAPEVIQGTFGAEALNEIAADVAPLLPLPFFSELNLTVFKGENPELFTFATEEEEKQVGTDINGKPVTATEEEPRPSPDKARYLVHSKNLFDLTDAATLEFGLSYLSGLNNAGDDSVTTATGADLTFKHTPLRGRGRAGTVLQAEWIDTTRETPAQELASSGYYVSFQQRFTEFWWIQARHGAFTEDELAGGVRTEEESVHDDVMLAWVPTEFSAFRFQYSRVEVGEADPEDLWYVQYVFTIGSHPAHNY